MPASRPNHDSFTVQTPERKAGRPAFPTARDIWRKTRRRLLKAASAPVAAAALVFPTLMEPAPAFAQNEIVDTGDVVYLGDLGGSSGTVNITQDGGNYLLFQKWINDGVGFHEGFTSIGLHSTIKDWGLTHLFSDVRLQITDHGRIGGNGLLGVRRTVGDGAVIGVWGGYDTWETINDNQYDQVSFGAEYLSPWFDIRANGYVPTNDDQNFVGFTGQGDDPFFAGNQIRFLDPALVEESISGWDVEVGVPTPSQAARIYAGAYGLNPDLRDSVVGARGRLELRATEDLSVNFIGSYDEIYNGSFNVVAELRFAARPGTSGFLPCYDCNYRRHGQVRRNWAVQTLASNVLAERAAIDPATGDPLVFTHVDNTNPQPGDGTFENPFQQLPDSALASDFILVDRGVGVTSGNITLGPGQSFLGEGKPQIVTTQRGDFALANVASDTNFNVFTFEDAGILPTLQPTDVNSPVITIDDDAVVRGFNITGPNTSQAIAGTDVNNFLIECINATIGDGIFITDATGTGIVRDSTFNSTDDFGAFFGNDGGALDLLIQDVDFAGVGANGEFGVRVAADGGDIRTELRDVTIDGFNQIAASIEADNGSLDLVTRDLTITDSGNGLIIDGDNTNTLSADIAQTNITTVGDGIRVDSTDSQLAVMIDDSNVAAGGTAIGLDGDNVTGTFDATNTNAANAGVDGVNLALTNGSDVTSNLDALVLDGAGEDGIDVDATVNSTVTVTANNVTAMNVGQNAAEFQSETGSQVNATLTNFDGTGAANDGVRAIGIGGDITLNGTDLTLTGVGGDGLDIASGDGTIDGTLNNVDVSGAGNDGVQIAAVADGTVDMTFNTIDAIGSGDRGLNVTAGVAGSPGDVTLAMNDADFSGSQNTNVEINSSELGSVANITVADFNASNSLAGNGIEVNSENAGQTIFQGTDVRGNGNTAGSGLIVDSTGIGSTSAANINDGSFSDNAVDGVQINGDSGSTSVAQLTQVNIDRSGVNGIEVDLTDAGTNGILNLGANSTILDSGVDAIDFNVQNGANFVATGTGTTMTGSGGFSFDGSVEGDGSQATVAFDGADASGSALGGADLEVGTVAGAASQTFTFSNGSLAGAPGGTGGDALRIETDNASSTVATITNSDLSGRDDDGVDARFDNASTGTVTLTNVDASGSGDRGLRVSSENASDVNFNVTNVDASSSGNDGAELIAGTGGQITSVIDTLDVSDNVLNGLQLNASGAGTDITLSATNVTGDGNQLEGLNSDTLTGATTTAEFFGGSFSNNGLGAASDGVNVRSNGTGSLADFCFDGTVADNNTDNGFDFNAQNDGTLIASLITSGGFGTLSGSNNVNEGLRVTGNGANQVIVTSSGANEFNNNGAGTGANGVTYDFNGVDTVAVMFSGSVSNSGGDGVNVSIVDAETAAVMIGDPTLATPSLIQNNGDDGIDVTVRSTDPLNPTNMDVVTIGVGKQAGATVDPLAIVNNDTSNNTTQGIVFNGENIFVAGGTDPRIDNNISNNNLNGDGISVVLETAIVAGAVLGERQRRQQQQRAWNRHQTRRLHDRR